MGRYQGVSTLRSREGGSSRRRGLRRNSIFGSWKDVCDAYLGKGCRGMRGKLVREVGNGEGTDFLTDLWVGAMPLKDAYIKFYRLCNK